MCIVEIFNSHPPKLAYDLRARQNVATVVIIKRREGREKGAYCIYLSSNKPLPGCMQFLHENTKHGLSLMAKHYQQMLQADGNEDLRPLCDNEDQEIYYCDPFSVFRDGWSCQCKLVLCCKIHFQICRKSL